MSASRTLLRTSQAAFLALLCLGSPVLAQDPAQLAGLSQDQMLQLLQENPQLRELVRRRLQESGQSLDQVRSQLAAAGYSPDLLDAFIGGQEVDPTFFNPNTIRAISLLGVGAFQDAQVMATAPDTVGPRLVTDSLRADSIVQEEAHRAVSELTLFGLDVFRQPTTQFQPLVAGPVDGSYRLGPGDMLVLLLTGAVELTQILEVTNGGFVLIPRVGQIFVNSLTLDQLRSVLCDRLGSAFSGVTCGPDAKTEFDVVVARVRVQTVRVLGEVPRPGSYQIAATGGVLSAIYEAGGLSERGSFRGVQIRRGRDLVATVDLYDYLLRGIVQNDVRLEPGDVVFVPVHGPRVKIAGEIARPAIYELKTGETLQDLIRIAGGLTPYASTQTATIDRVLPPEQRPEPGHARTVLTANIGDGNGSAAPAVTLLAADSVTILPIRGGRRDAVTISGSVWQPGTFRLDEGMRLWDLIRAAGGLRPDTYEGRAQIVRVEPDSTRRMFGVFLDSDGSPDPADDPPLREGDDVTVFSRTEFRPVRLVAVDGAVRRPGMVAFSDSMTLRDAILLAGGLTDDAYLLEAEVSRLPPDQNGESDSLATILKTPLDSSYVFDPTGYVRRPVGGSNAGQFLLHPYDNIFVRRQPGWKLQRNVVITGEVQLPGHYTLALKDERLSSLISRAGGLTAEAYARGMQFIRAEGNVGSIAVDLPRVLRDPSHRENLILVPGDSIHIPRFIPTVRVDGAVNFPSSVTYVPGAGVDYYIDAAGGAAHRADKGRSFVRQPNGLIQRGQRPEPGAVVIVPQKDPSARGLAAALPFFSALVSVLATTATLIIALNR